MRVPNLNVSQSIMQQLRDLDSQRLKLNDQISTGQKITRPQDDGLTMGRVIQLDSQKGKLAQYQRNASYATEYLNAGHMNLDKLREINQRAQEIARLAGSNLNGPGVSAYALEIDQLLEEALNRLNARHRGRALFGGHELKPNFAMSDVKSEDLETKFLNLNTNSVGIEKVGGNRYLKQGDQLSVSVNGREYVVEAKTLDVVDYDQTLNYIKGDLVKTVTPQDDSILLDSSLSKDNQSLFDTVIQHLAFRDWSKDPVGSVEHGDTSVYLLDTLQIESLAVSLGNQPFVDFLPPNGGYFAISEQTDGSVLLEPVENHVSAWSPSKSYQTGDYVSWGTDVYRSLTAIPPGTDFENTKWQPVPFDEASQLFSLTNSTVVDYWEALDSTASNLEVPSEEALAWRKVDIQDSVSNLSTDEATSLLRDLINSDPFFLEGSQVLDSEDSYAFIRSSSNPDDRYDPDLDLTAKVDSSGQLVIKGRVGTRFDTQASYISLYDPDNYYPNQLEVVVRQKASLMFPNLSFDELDEKAKELVWAEVKSSKITWDLSVAESSGPSGTTMHSKLPSSWARLQVYQLGDIVEYDGKLWESKMSENFNHFPTNPASEYWVEIGSGYDQSREDWNLQSVGTQVNYFFTSPDGRLFHDRSNAESHTYDLLVGSDRNYASVNEIWSDIDKLVKEVAYPISKFQANGSESKAQIYFDSVSQSYRLGVLDSSDSKVQGTFIIGGVKGSSDDNIEAGDVVQYRGTYFLTLHASLNEDTSTVDPTTLAESLNAVQGKLSDNVSIGDKIYDQSAGAIYMFLGDKLPAIGKELILSENEQQPLRKGNYIYDRSTDSFYVATEDIADANEENLASSSSLAKISSSTFAQGSEWNSSEKYFKGQIVLYKGTYYECQTNGILDPNGNVLGFDNQDDDQVPVGEGYYNPVVAPTDEFFLDVSDAKTQEYMDLQKARGQTIANNVWLPITNPIKHVLSFKTENPDDADVRIQPAGISGVDADIAVMTDINGDVTGLRIDNPGRYYFPNASANGLSFSIPEEFQEAEIFLPNGESLKAKIIWGQNPNDPGPFVVRGFELLDAGRVDKPMSLATGENFSFATGKKTFLDHRDEEGKLLGITYTGADKNSEFFIGKDSKVSSYLNAENGGTSELANSILSLIDLREGLYEEDLSERSQMVQSAEQQLIGQEDEVVDKMVELSAIMARMETVKAHDEQYHLELDRRLAQELDIDMSDAIMRLTRASTAYQAAMQVGAQLLNTSLLNYL